MFRAQSQEIKERGGNQSTGIDFFITQERVIFLDTQVRMIVDVIISHLWTIRLFYCMFITPKYILKPS